MSIFKKTKNENSGPLETRFVAKIGDPLQQALKRISDVMADPAFTALVNKINYAAGNSEKPEAIEESFIAKLIYYALTLPGTQLRPLVRDIITNIVSSKESYRELAASDAAAERRELDRNILAQRFLLDEYNRGERA